MLPQNFRTFKFTATVWHNFNSPTEANMGRDSSVGIANSYGLEGPSIESRQGARISASVQTGPGAHPARCTVDTGSFPGVKRPGRGTDYPPPSKCRGHEKVGLHLYSTSGPQWPVKGRTFTLTLYLTEANLSVSNGPSLVHDIQGKSLFVRVK